MEREELLNVIESTISSMRLPYETKVKKDKWKADVVVDYGRYKVAFNIGKSPRNVAEQYGEMRSERVCGCWLLLPSKNPPYYGHGFPCFSVLEDNTVALGCQKIDLQTFIRSIIEGKVRYAQSIQAKAVEVCFYQKECWKCHRPSYSYMVVGVVSDNNIKFEIENFDPDLSVNANIANGVQRYLSLNPRTNIIMGEYKPRYSKTRGTSYPSFGCPYCDSLFGNYFSMDEQMEMIYEKDRLPHAIVELNNRMPFDVNQWYMLK